MDWRRELAWLAVELLGEDVIAIELLERQADLARATWLIIQATFTKELSRYLLLTAFYGACAVFATAVMFKEHLEWQKRKHLKRQRRHPDEPPPSWTGRSQ